MICAEVLYLESNEYPDWEAFAGYESADPYDDFGWFHVRIGASDGGGGNDFQVCVSTPRAIGRSRRSGGVPGVIVDRFDAATIHEAICERVSSVEGRDWEEIVEQLRKFMRWEYERMAGG